MTDRDCASEDLGRADASRSSRHTPVVAGTGGAAVTEDAAHAWRVGYQRSCILNISAKRMWALQGSAWRHAVARPPVALQGGMGGTALPGATRSEPRRR